MSSCWVHFRKVSAKKGDDLRVCRENIEDISRPFGKVVSVLVLQGRGQAMLQMNDPEAAADVIEHFSGLPEMERPAFLSKAITEEGRGPKQDPCLSGSHTNIQQEVSRCINGIIKEVLSAYNKARHHEREKLGKRKSHEVESLEDHSSKKHSQQQGVCFDFVVTGGRCPRGDACRSRHVELSIADLPAKYRVFEDDNQFPLARELGNSSGVYICKSIVNDLRHGNYRPGERGYQRPTGGSQLADWQQEVSCAGRAC